MAEIITKVDSKPIYLGYQEDLRKYCFYVIKDGMPRFLSFIAYFFWDKGPQTVLKLKAVPGEVELELQQFLEGRIEYELFRKRSNSKDQSVRRIFRLPEQYSSSETISVDTRPDRVSGGAKPRLSSGRNSSSQPSTSQTSLPSRRDPGRLGHVVDASRKTVDSISNGVKVKPEPKKRKEIPTVEVDGGVSIQKTASVEKMSSKMLSALEKTDKPKKALKPEEIKSSKPDMKKVLETKSLKPKEAEISPIKEKRSGRPKVVSTLENAKEASGKSKPSSGPLRGPVVNENKTQSKPRRPKSG